MNYAVEMGSGVIIYISSLMKFDITIQRDAQTNRKRGD
jgi:hypothetical protein